MTSGEPGYEQRRAVETFAQALYEAEDPGGIAWAKRTRIVREPWLTRARRQLQTPNVTPGVGPGFIPAFNRGQPINEKQT